MPAPETEIIGPESATEQLAKILYRELEHCDPKTERDWAELTDFEREVYRTAIEGLLLAWDLLLRARADLKR